MKIFKTVIANISMSDDVKRGEKKTKDIIDSLFKKYQKGKMNQKLVKSILYLYIKLFQNLKGSEYESSFSYF